jgi:transposase
MPTNETLGTSSQTSSRGARPRAIRSPCAEYTADFLESAVQLVLRDGKSIAGAARQLDVNLKAYSNWIKAARAGSLQRIDTHRIAPVSELQSEVSRLRRALAQVSEERDILKKATAYFARIAK